MEDEYGRVENEHNQHHCKQGRQIDLCAHSYQNPRRKFESCENTCVAEHLQKGHRCASVDQAARASQALCSFH